MKNKVGIILNPLKNGNKYVKVMNFYKYSLNFYFCFILKLLYFLIFNIDILINSLDKVRSFYYHRIIRSKYDRGFGNLPRVRGYFYRFGAALLKMQQFAKGRV